MVRRLAAFPLLFCLLCLAGSALAQEGDLWDEFLPTGEYYTLLDPGGRVLLETGRRIYLEDQYLTQDNRLYEVVEVDDAAKTARAKLVAEVELEVTPWSQLRRDLGLTAVEAADEGGPRGTIALYHTHNAESYVPTDGTDSIYGKGGIHQVGATFAEALKERGVTVHYSEKLHLPHDRGAYRRSRETVLELISQEPDAIFDVHRDAAPSSAYAIQLKDQWMTSIQFVVGRQNQNLGVNRKYAESLKKVADDLYPGLVKGIFYGRGNYNQDLSPLSLLLEVGAHTNSRPAAERGISLFAEVVDHYFYGPSAEAASRSQAGAARRSALGLGLFVSAGVAVFYVVNAGGVAPALERLKGALRLRNRR
ncbi:stage II sporulation protein P [Candidatus Darwinibacter acetoxidans]